MYGHNIVERAFELAAECRDLDVLRARLKREGFMAVDAHFSSRSLRRDLSGALLTDSAPQ